jgi:hypothetical protein
MPFNQKAAATHHFTAPPTAISDSRPSFHISVAAYHNTHSILTERSLSNLTESSPGTVSTNPSSFALPILSVRATLTGNFGGALPV